MFIARQRGVSLGRWLRSGLLRLFVSSAVLMLSGCGLASTERAKPSPAETPSGDLPGWKQVFREDFDKADVPLGEFPGDAYRAKWSAGYNDGTPDTAGQKGKD